MRLYTLIPVLPHPTFLYASPINLPLTSSLLRGYPLTPHFPHFLSNYFPFHYLSFLFSQVSYYFRSSVFFFFFPSFILLSILGFFLFRSSLFLFLRSIFYHSSPIAPTTYFAFYFPSSVVCCCSHVSPTIFSLWSYDSFRYSLFVNVLSCHFLIVLFSFPFIFPLPHSFVLFSLVIFS